MSWLPEESLLLAKNWETVEDILAAVQRLQGELTQVLLSVGRELSEQSWWDDGWRLIEQGNAQVYISSEKWRVGDGFLMWIGVEQFTPKAVFGSDSPAQLYVWVADREYDLAHRLAAAILDDADEPLGDIDHGANGYVVKQLVGKCFAGEVEGYDERVRRQIAGFFAHYAEVLSGLDGMIQEHIAGMEKGV